MSELREKLVDALNRACAENGSDTPDFILAEYLIGCLAAFDQAVVAREAWYCRTAKRGDRRPGFVDPESEEAKPRKVKWAKPLPPEDAEKIYNGAFPPPDLSVAQPVETDTFDDMVRDHNFVRPETGYEDQGKEVTPDVCQFEIKIAPGRAGMKNGGFRMCHRKEGDHVAFEGGPK